MTLEQCEKRNELVLENAMFWALGKSCSPLYQEDVAILGEYLNVRIPAAFYKFECSECAGNVRAYGNFATISKTMDKIQNKLLTGNWN